MLRTGTLIVAAATMIALSGCASAPADHTLRDPIQGINCAIYEANSAVDRALIKPLAKTYMRGDQEKLPGKLRRRVSNFLDNLHGPVDISNNLLQGKFKRGFSGIGRLLVNSTIGLGGLFDPAARWGMRRHAEDFGQTLAKWGVPPGPYLVLPVIGPSSVRDLFGRLFDWQLSPIAQSDDRTTRYGLYTLSVVETRAGLLSRDYTLKLQYDEYIYLRDTYATDSFNDAFYDGDSPLDLSIYSVDESSARTPPPGDGQQCR
jgi:phospholipid-binding lipoprotein MlaA